MLSSSQTFSEKSVVSPTSVPDVPGAPGAISARRSGPLSVAVIGGGITGVTTAYALMKRGAQVTLFDRHPYAAMETSFANGGQLSASNAEVWNSWTTVLKGIKWMFSPGAPLLVNPRPSWHKLSWMAEFIGNIPRYEENTITTARLAIEARAHLLKMAADEGIDFDCEARGILHIYGNKADFESAARVSTLLAKGGLERRAVTPEEMLAIEPALRGHYYGGFYTPSDFTGDIHKFTYGLAKACERQGVVLKFGHEVEDIDAQADHVMIRSLDVDPADAETHPQPITERFDKVVVCAGVMSREIGGRLGDRINVYPVKGYSITVNLADADDRAAAPWVSLLDDRSKIVTSRLGADRLRVAGTAEFNGYNRDIRADRIAPLVDWCRVHFPGMSTRQSVPWAGLRPMMPDMLPRVSFGRNPNVLYNTGHGHLGWTLSAATADAVSALATTVRNAA
jgi:D-amino-acid dehydrogenase